MHEQKVCVASPCVTAASAKCGTRAEFWNGEMKGFEMSDDIEKAIDGADYQAKWNLCAQALANAYEDEAGIIVLAGEGVVAFVPVGKLMGQQEPRHDMRYLSQDSGVAFAIKTDGLYHIRLFELRDSSLGLSFSELATGAGPEPAFMRLDKFTRDEITKAEYEAAMATA